MTFSHEDFLRALDAHDYNFEVGQTVKGKVSSHTNEGAYIDIGGKSAALLPEREVNMAMDAKLAEILPVGTDREFLIIKGQDENGQITLSVRQLEIKAFWAELQGYDPTKTLTVRVTGINKGGITANVKGIKAFIPRSHVVQRENLEELIGQRLTVVILEADPERQKLVLSQRQARRAQRINELAIGQLVSGKVADLRPFGAFVDLDGITALLHINNISQKYVSSVGAVLPIGTAVKALVTDLDIQRGRVSLSTSVLEIRPGEMLDSLAAVMAEAEDRLTQHLQKLDEKAAAEAAPEVESEVEPEVEAVGEPEVEAVGEPEVEAVGEPIEV